MDNGGNTPNWYWKPPMKLLSVKLARSIWHLDTAELNPRGKNVFNDLIPGLVAEHYFKEYPKEGDDFKEGMQFKNGIFRNRAGDEVVVSGTLWADGIAADTCSSTKDSDEFIERALGLIQTLGYSYHPSMIRRRGYLSQLYVRCEKQLDTLNPRLRDLGNRISSAIGVQSQYGFAAIEFWPDQTKSFKPAVFSFQKQSGEDLSGDRYWAQASMQTDKHLEILNDMESLLLP
jgi:hypothetical protein